MGQEKIGIVLYGFISCSWAGMCLSNTELLHIQTVGREDSQNPRDLCCASVFAMDFLLFKCSLLHLYHVSNLTVFKALFQLIDSHLIVQGCRTTQYWWKGSSAQGHTMNPYDYENNPGIFNIHEEQT